MDVYTESSGIDTSPEMNSSIEVHSPDRVINVQPRKLTFSFSPDQSMNNEVQKEYMTASLAESPKKPLSISPPYRKVRALRLFDTPATPKTIIEKSAKSIVQRSCFNNLLAKTVEKSSMLVERPKALPLHNRALDNLIPSANINPFTPNSFIFQRKKRSRLDIGAENRHNNSLPSSFLCDQKKENLYSDDEEGNEWRQAPKRLALQDTNISRYKQEFLELSLIGVGEFGLVYQCLNRLDGCVYAIKKSIKPVAGSSFEKTALNEVWAHAVLGKHENVVRYYSAWAEDSHMLIQNEYCDQGSLQTLLQSRFLTESELRTLLVHIAEGLKYIHSNKLVHMDLKAGNIFLTRVPTRPTSPLESLDAGFEELYEELENSEYSITYKIGDLGHVTSIKHPQVEEGDCRYLPNEILQEDYRNLFKADIFSLGLTIYEAGGGYPLPKNGPEWHQLRNGQVPDLPKLSREFNDLIKLMTHPDPEKRPTCQSILDHDVLHRMETITKAQLSRELFMERTKNHILVKKLKETRKLLKSYEKSNTPIAKKTKNQSPIASDRRLRSYTKKRQRTDLGKKRRNIRDKNKNVIHEIEF